MSACDMVTPSNEHSIFSFVKQVYLSIANNLGRPCQHESSLFLLMISNYIVQTTKDPVHKYFLMSFILGTITVLLRLYSV